MLINYIVKLAYFVVNPLSPWLNFIIPPIYDLLSKTHINQFIITFLIQLVLPYFIIDRIHSCDLKKTSYTFVTLE